MPVGGFEFEVVATRTLAATPQPFLALVEHDVRAPDGELLVRHVVEHPGAVVVVPIAADGRALLVRQWRVATGGDLLEVPAGKRDVDGEEPIETARRELEEEIGFRPGRLVRLAECWLSPGFCTELAHVFVGLDLEPVTTRPELRAEEEAMTVEPVALDDVEEMIATGALRDAKSIVGLLLARAYVRGAYAGMAP